MCLDEYIFELDSIPEAVVRCIKLFEENPFLMLRRRQLFAVGYLTETQLGEYF